MKDEDVDSLIKVIKAIILYLEKDEVEIEKEKKEGKTENEEDKKVILFSR